MSSTPKCCHAAAIASSPGLRKNPREGGARIGLQGRGQIDLLLAFHAYPLEVPLGFQLLPNVIGLIRTRALAVANSKRMTALPDIPTAAEAGLPSGLRELCLAGLARASQHQKGRDRHALCSDAGSDQRSEGARPLRRAGAEPLVLAPQDRKYFMASETSK